MTDAIVPAEPLATAEVALVVSTLSNDALDAYLCDLSAERLAEFVLRIAAVARLAARARQVGTTRLVELGQTGAVFTDPADGVRYHFTGGRHRQIKDVPGFVAQLAAEGIDARPLIPWLSSSAFKVGADIMGDPRVAAAVKDWARWVDDTLTLVELGPDGRPVRR